VNSLYKKGLINREGPWQDAGQVTVATAEWVFWYNDDRLHSACGNIPPVEYENARLTSPDRPISFPRLSIVASNEPGRLKHIAPIV
jgi:transposase InsO family protein